MEVVEFGASKVVVNIEDGVELTNEVYENIEMSINTGNKDGSFDDFEEDVKIKGNWHILETKTIKIDFRHNDIEYDFSEVFSVDCFATADEIEEVATRDHHTSEIFNNIRKRFNEKGLFCELLTFETYNATIFENSEGI